jgi:hypothetical protein
VRGFELGKEGKGVSMRRRLALAWTECDYAVVMAEPLHVRDIEQELRLPAIVRFWECRDTHYELQAGYFDDVARHSNSIGILSL